MRMINAFVPKQSKLVKDHNMDVGKTIIYIPGGGQLHIITNSAGTEEGALTTFSIMDQTESWTHANGGRELAETINRNLRKSKNRGVETSNAWKPGQESVAEGTFDAWEKEQEGRTKGRSKTLMDIRMAPADMNLDERDSILAGVQHAYGDCYWVDCEDIVDNGVYDLKTPLSDSKRFYFNWPTVSEDAWVEPQQWDRMSAPDFYMADGEDIALGFDGSRTRDATALIGCHIKTGYVFTIGIWEPTQATEHKDAVPVPVKEVDAAVQMAFDTWNVVAFFADVREWESFTKVEWPKRYAQQLSAWSVNGTKDPQPIAWDMRSHDRDFTLAAEMVCGEIENDGRIEDDGTMTYAFYHDGDSTLRRHVCNARRDPRRWGIAIDKESRDSPLKIDGCTAMIIARHARRLVLSSEEYSARDEKKQGKVWSFS